jgi:nucleoside 2-deoxyribosyltransferase
MPEQRSLSIYLAGPVTNCNEKQKTEWRKAIKAKIAKAGHKSIDPVDHTDWRPLKETVEIDRCDIVIANLWRESVGTVIGIMQARSRGKSVILIDPNYLENSALQHLVGKDFIVRGIDEAVNLLPQFVEQLNKVVSVKKSDGTLEPFTPSKLHDSLKAACARAHVEDAILPDLVANAVHGAVMKAEKNGQIHADQIKRLVFNKLSEIATDNLYEEELKKRAGALRHAWDEYERVKKDQRWALERIVELERELGTATEKIQALEAQNVSCRAELGDLRSSLRKFEHQTNGDDVADIAAGTARFGNLFWPTCGS